MPFQNPNQDDIRALLRKVRTIAVVGLSPQPARPSYKVAREMRDFGYRIVPVRPGVAEVLGEKAYASLAEIPEPIDLVDVFRAAEHIDALVDECLRLNIPAIWIQEGVVNEPAARRARDGGMTVVMDRCIYKEYLSLLS